MIDILIASAYDYTACYVHSMSLSWKQTEQNLDLFWDDA